jgi:hypothetical protein
MAVRDWFISGAGSDSTGDGSIGNPYKTVGKVLDPTTPLCAAGDSIRIQTGYTYAEYVRVKSTLGTAAAGLDIAGYTTTRDDMSGTMGFALVAKDSGIPGDGPGGNAALFMSNSSFITVRNIKATTAQAYAWAFFSNNVASNRYINCTASCLSAAFYMYSGSNCWVDTCRILTAGDAAYPAVFFNSSSSPGCIDTRFDALNANALGAVTASYTNGVVVMGNTFYQLTAASGYGIVGVGSTPNGFLVRSNTFNNCGGSLISGGAIADMTGLLVEWNILVGTGANKAVFSSAGSNVRLGRFAHNAVYNCGSPYFSTNIITVAEDTVTTNPFVSGETLSANAQQHAVLMADGSTYTYPDFGAMQAQTFPSTDPGIANVVSGVAYTIAGVSLTGTFNEAVRNVDPGVANVVIGTSYKIQNSSLVGTFDESARNTDPGVLHVMSGVTYKILNVSYTGSLLMATASDLQQLTAKFAGMNNVPQVLQQILSAVQRLPR